MLFMVIGPWPHYDHIVKNMIVHLYDILASIKNRQCGSLYFSGRIMLLQCAKTLKHCIARINSIVNQQD